MSGVNVAGPARPELAGLREISRAGVAGAVVIWRLALALRADFLFERPGAFWIAPKKAAPALQPAE